MIKFPKKKTYCSFMLTISPCHSFCSTFEVKVVVQTLVEILQEMMTFNFGPEIWVLRDKTKVLHGPTSNSTYKNTKHTAMLL